MGLCSWLKGGTLLTTPKTSTLAQRTSEELVKALESLGAVIEGGDKLPMVIKGGIKGGKVEISGKSSQYISSLLMIGPVLDKGIDVTITDNLNSKPYLEMTIEVMEKAGIKVKANKDFTQFAVKPSEYKPFEFTVPGDYSSAAPIMCAALATWSEISIYGLKEDKQGDRVVLKALKEMGGQITEGDELKIKPAELHGIELDGKATPDIVPPLAALASMCSGESRFYNISHLRNKESDRISDLATELKKIGANIKEKPDELKIIPGSVKHALINPHNDHRIAMALTVVGLGGKGIRLNDPSCVLKSYPTFFRDLEILGANIHP